MGESHDHLCDPYRLYALVLRRKYSDSTYYLSPLILTIGNPVKNAPIFGIENALGFTAAVIQIRGLGFKDL